MQLFDTQLILFLVLILGGLILFFFYKSRCSWSDTQSFDSLRTEYPESIIGGNIIYQQTNNGEDSNQDSNQDFNQDSDLPEPDQAQIPSSLGQAKLSMFVPQVWTSQGDNLIRDDQGCDLLI